MHASISIESENQRKNDPFALSSVLQSYVPILSGQLHFGRHRARTAKDMTQGSVQDTPQSLIQVSRIIDLQRTMPTSMLIKTRLFNRRNKLVTGLTNRDTPDKCVSIKWFMGLGTIL